MSAPAQARTSAGHARNRRPAHVHGSTVGVISLGCAKNLVDTERLLGLLAATGFTIVNEPERAEILVVNTCGFIEPAKQESIDTILEMAQYKTRGRCKTLVVTGCLSQRYREELHTAMPEIDILLGVREYDALPELLGAAPCPVRAEQVERVLSTPPYSAYLRIGDGCSNRCAYCAIPLIRGPLASAPQETLLEEAMRLADRGVTELTLIAQDTSGYGLDRYGEPRLAFLLERLSNIAALEWIRVLYTYPDTVTPALIDCIRGTGKVTHYLDMPLQHISDPVLKAMNRRGSSGQIRALMEYLAQNAPDFILRTTMMVGFPGESEQDFNELMAFLREHPFDRVGAFAFSPEEGTPAADMPDQIPEAVKAARLDALMSQQRRISKARAERRVGTKTKFLVEGYNGGYLFGRTYGEAPDVDGRVLVNKPEGAPPPIGSYVPIRLTKALEYDMIGELLCTK